jgi:hypothetical protein
MNKRKFKRSKGTTGRTKMIVSQTAALFANYAIDGVAKIHSLGNFIFLSTVEGEAWMLDHRENHALRLADGYKALPYKIKETKDNFAVGWTEKFTIDNESFIALGANGQRVFANYPVKELNELIENLKRTPSK